MSKVNYIQNPAGLGAILGAKSARAQISTASAALSSGRNSPLSNIQTFTSGATLISSVTVQKSIVSAMKYSTGLLNSAVNTLVNVRAQVDNLKGVIARAASITPGPQQGAMLQALDNEYKSGLTAIQSTLDSAVYGGGNYVFNHVGNSTFAVRIAEAPTSTVTVTLPDLRANALNVRHALDVFALDNTDPLGTGNNLRLAYQNDGTYMAGSTIAGVTDAAVGINEFKTVANPMTNPLLTAGAAPNANANGAGGGLILTNAAYGVNAGGYAALQVVGSIFNTLQAVTVGGVVAGAQANGTISAGNVGAVGIAGVFITAAANGWNGTSSATTNQGIAGAIVNALGNFVDTNLTVLGSQLNVLNNASNALEVSAKDNQEVANDLLSADIMENAAIVSQNTQALAVAIGAFKQGAQVGQMLGTLLQ